MKVLLREKHVTLINNYTKTYLKIGVNIDHQDFLRGIFTKKATIKEHEVFFKAIIFYINWITFQLK